MKHHYQVLLPLVWLAFTSNVAADVSQIAYLKASNTGFGDNFGAGGSIAGDAVTLSGDGNTLVVGAPYESSGTAGVNGDQNDESVYGSGAVYVFVRDGASWLQQAYLKPSNPGFADNFGFMTALSGNGDTLVVSAHFEAGGGKGVDADQTDDSIPQAGAVYLFERDGESWVQQAYIKASNTGELGGENEYVDGDQFGASVAISEDGNTFAVSAVAEDGGLPGVNSDFSDNSALTAGAVYLFNRSGDSWVETTYIKPSNPDAQDFFGYSVSLNSDGTRLAVGSYDEDGSIAGTNTEQDNEARGSGAIYVFDQNKSGWEQTAYLKASNAERGDSLGASVAISNDGRIIVGTALDEDGITNGVNDIPGPDGDVNISTGAVYAWVYDGAWSQQAYIKASNTDPDDVFGARLALSGDGLTLAVGAQLEDSSARGINGPQEDNSATDAGAVYVFSWTGEEWEQEDYVKAANAEEFDEFGSSLSLSNDGSVLAVGAHFEDSSATGNGGDPSDNSAFDSGAVYLFSR
tara:strand:- start:12656 stop:14212 length:1557 start_codon:yes stop_codon:yes gene_type:complete